SAGLLSGSLTESPAIGTASEAIRSLSLPDEQKQLWIGHIAVADAICYIFGTLGVIWCCSSLGPKLLRFDLRAESKKVEASLGIQRSKLGVYSAWQPIGFRAYKIPEDGLAVGTTVAEADDTVAVLGRTEFMIKALGPSAREVADPELLEISVVSFDLYITTKTIAGKTLQEIVDGVEEARGVLLRGITRGGHDIPIGTNTVIKRGDTLHVTGSETAVEKLAPVVGRVIHPTDESDLAVLGTAIFIGILVGAVLTIPVGHL